MPWKDEAVASLHPPANTDAPPRVIATGTLLNVALDLASHDPLTLNRARISLPYRGHSPFSFQGMALMKLIADARTEAGRAKRNAV
ncbi:MAG: hypothetical protein EOO77_28900 [Oxalobacteraceae bacterium]|nr:MAG: hypothetical protein EOO77_28900 [Oxalobacteraceae bacterium]